MNTKRWVQHISGTGTKWEVNDFCYPGNAWRVEKPGGMSEGGMSYHYLPKSEYVLCDPPETWQPVEAEGYMHLRCVFTRDGQQVDGEYRFPIQHLEKRCPNEPPALLPGVPAASVHAQN